MFYYIRDLQDDTFNYLIEIQEKIEPNLYITFHLMMSHILKTRITIEIGDDLQKSLRTSRYVFSSKLYNNKYELCPA